MATRLHGVNLGGWLVIEKWMTPSLFTDTNAVDEYTLSRHAAGPKRIEKHRQTFIAERDFKWLRDHDITIVRIPVGYWLFDTIDGYTPTVGCLDSAMEWAERYNIKVLIDLHAARGSQNGRDHSGKVGDTQWFDNKAHQNDTLAVLEKIANRYKDSPALWGIEILNEPAATSIRRYFTLLGFYRRAYKTLSELLPPGIAIVFHDAFHPLLFTGALPRHKSHPAIMDVHWYGFASRKNNYDSFLRTTALKRKWLLRFIQLWQPVVIGEWSGVMPNQFLDNATPLMIRQNISSQRLVYEQSAGHIFWTYRVESTDAWNFRNLVDMFD